jgi:uncharacterized membrane protein
MSRIRLMLLGQMAAIVLFALLLAVPTTIALAQEPPPEVQPLPTPDRIAGDVIQVSSGADVPNGLEVTLITYSGTGSPISEKSVAVGADGAFEFTGFQKGDGYRYELVTNHGNLLQTVRVEDAINAEEIGLRIFETTPDLDGISVTTHVMIVPRVDGKDRIMGVLELVQISNGGDRTFVADLANPAPDGLPRLLRFSLPSGYEDLTVDSDLPSGTVLEIETGFALSNAVPPGDFRILYSYTSRYDGSETVFSRGLPNDVHEYRVLLPDEAGTASAPGFFESGTETLGETTYKVLTRTGIPSGERFEISFTDLPEPTTFQSIQNILGGSTWATIGVPAAAAIAMAVLLGYVFIYRPRRQPRFAPGTAGREALVKEIADLDRRYEAGEIDDETYAAERQALFDLALEAEAAGK